MGQRAAEANHQGVVACTFVATNHGVYPQPPGPQCGKQPRPPTPTLAGIISPAPDGPYMGDRKQKYTPRPRNPDRKQRLRYTAISKSTTRPTDHPRISHSAPLRRIYSKSTTRPCRPPSLPFCFQPCPYISIDSLLLPSLRPACLRPATNLTPPTASPIIT